MKLLVYNRVKYNRDKTAISFAKYLGEFLGSRENCICLYEEPDFVVEGNVLPTFTIVDKEYGIVFIKIYEHTNDILTELSEKAWVVNGNKERNQFVYFDNYCHKCISDINSPINDLGDVSNKQIACFPHLEKKKLSIDIKKSRHVLFSDYRAYDVFSGMSKQNLDDIQWAKLNSIIQKANVLAKDSGLMIEEPITNLREAIAINNQKIYQFDDTQLDASLKITDSCEQIRGLAGTGKTIILAIKAAKLHRYNPNMKIAYVFYTHSLYTQVTGLIRKYYNKLTGDDPNWDNLKILHAWGGKTVGEGFLYNICKSNGLDSSKFSEVSQFVDPFGEACRRVVVKDLKEEYDIVLIDEAQDLPISFFQLVGKVTKKPKQIVIAYDQLQTTEDTKMPMFEELFGRDKNGKFIVKLDKENDYILKRSYRNDISVLMTALGFGFGLYSDIVQIIKNKSDWEALGFNVLDGYSPNGDLKYGSSVKIERLLENSPNNVSKFYKRVSPVTIKTLESKEDELDYVSTKVDELIHRELVKPHDIMIIDLRSRARQDLEEIQRRLYANNVSSIIPGIIDESKSFIVEENVTLTTPRRAKGNEVPVVFVLGADTIYSSSSKVGSRLHRNAFFISVTRSKGWVFISTCTEAGGKRFIEEYEKIRKNIPLFVFKFPTAEQISSLATIDYMVKSGETEVYEKNVEAFRNILKSNADIEKMKLILDDDTKDLLKKLLGE